MKSLPDYPFRSNFVTINGMQIHYIDEGESGSPAILFLHGVPTWSFTFRKIIPRCLENGLRVIAPDLPGFGKSEKPRKKEIFTLNNLIEWMEEFIRKRELSRLIIFGHDWGAIIGMILAARNPELFSGMILCNGYLPATGQRIPFQLRLWKWFTRFSPVVPVGCVISCACKRHLSKAERAGYDYPFQRERDKTAIRILPQLISFRKDKKEVSLFAGSWSQLKSFEKPVLTVFSSDDPITRGGDRIIQSLIPGAGNQPHRLLDGKHFLQEDAPEELAVIICEFVKNNP